MAKRKGASTSGPRTRSRAAKERQVEDTRRLDKLPQEVWDKILDHLEENDLFPLALSCRYFRQKQKELVERTRQNGSGSGKPRRALKTTFHRMPVAGQPASADYLRFCSKEEVRDAELKVVYLVLMAAFHGHLPLLQELLKALNTLEEAVISYIAICAAKGGQVETLQWLEIQEQFKLNEVLFGHACVSGNLEVLKWLRSEGRPWDEDACAAAAGGGRLEVIKWLRSEGCPWNKWACANAASGGHLEVLKWLRSKGCPWDEKTCAEAAQGGNLKTLKWLRSEGCPRDASACSYAASRGYLEILKWLRSEGCPWDASACAGAARCGHSEVLKWLRSEGCPWDAMACFYAASGGHFEVLKWLRSKGCPWNMSTSDAAADVPRGNFEMLRWVIDNGCPYDVTEDNGPALAELGLI